MNILFIGDIIGGPGREKISNLLPAFKKKYSINFTIANGENSAGGIGISKKAADEILSSTVDVITLGNHSFDRKEFVDVIDYPYIIRPANYPEAVPGKGYCIMNNIAVINLVGRFNMPLVDCPFRTADRILDNLSKSNQKISFIIVDFHAELTAEKEAMGYYLDGRVSAVIGTHTHVQTADNKILRGGTGYITDVGMVGSKDSIIGVDKSDVIKRFLTGMPAKFQVARDNIEFNSVVLQIDDTSGKCVKIDRVNE
ncbi:MAG: metallophosphoesterase [Elusimicrobia bacterium RIFOXYC2_FULL_34_12]|nr:MAG: metallophosphoesterase [Elusimicrobia bacterium RIFOXYC2_FULL_34_12]